MSQDSKIEWTDATWNPVRGCTKVSPGCAHCYAETFAERWRGVPGHPYEQGFDLRLVPEKLTEPLKWRKPRRVFVNSMSDLFHKDIPDEFIDKVFAVMSLCPQHTMQVLSKRPERMAEYFLSNPLARIAALMYDVMYEQGTSITVERSVRDRIRREYLACCKATRQGREDGRRVSQWGDGQSMRSGQSGVSAAARVSIGDGDDQGKENCDRSASARLASQQRDDSIRNDDQPQEWNEGRQQNREPGIGNYGGATSARSDCAECQSESPHRFKASENQTERGRRSRDSSASNGWRTGEGDSAVLRDQSEGSHTDLYAADLEAYLTWPLLNVWLGVSVEDQKRADERIPLLLQVPALVRFLSCEPLLGPIDLTRLDNGGGETFNALTARATTHRGHVFLASDVEPINWVIVGGESGPRARPCDLAWIRSIVTQCRDAGVPCFVKQLGAKAYSNDRERMEFQRLRVKNSKGGDPNEWPEDLRVREFPR